MFYSKARYCCPGAVREAHCRVRMRKSRLKLVATCAKSFARQMQPGVKSDRCKVAFKIMLLLKTGQTSKNTFRHAAVASISLLLVTATPQWQPVPPQSKYNSEFVLKYEKRKAKFNETTLARRLFRPALHAVTLMTALSLSSPLRRKEYDFLQRQ